MPNHLKNNLDMLVKFKRVSRTSILNKIIEEFCRTELKLIKEDRHINELKGRKKSIDVDQVRKLSDEGMGATAISKLMGISRKSVYNALAVKDIHPN
jgi:hypothetical protein